ncbi:hypothetical protein RIF29_27180 [Crotalaria pallida]|uniref:Polygalacturonase n=1 Tax=Crotalaria pallida TaxID=3830 RepID=A0AAN9EQY4_CROPI
MVSIRKAYPDLGKCLYFDLSSGDDCIAIKGGTQFLEVSQVICGPGHGISVGSLGENGQTEFAEEIHIWNCTFKGASYGARIKTWPLDALKVNDVTFSDIHGTCSKEDAIVLDCAKIGCNHITLSQINITSIDPAKPASTICKNVQGTAKNVLPYVPCLH